MVTGGGGTTAPRDPATVRSGATKRTYDVAPVDLAIRSMIVRSSCELTLPCTTRSPPARSTRTDGKSRSRAFSLSSACDWASVSTTISNSVRVRLRVWSNRISLVRPEPLPSSRMARRPGRTW